MVGMVESSYYRVPSGSQKGNTPSKLTYHGVNGFVDQQAVIASINAAIECFVRPC